MKFTLSWLEKFLDIGNHSLIEISDSLTSLGHEVEEIIEPYLKLKDFTVAYIKNSTTHPNSNKLKICEIETADQVLQIICGAPNARTGIKVVLAKIGSEIPNGQFKIKETEIRGVNSQGMLCSAFELLIGPDDGTIIELPENAIIGDPIAKYFGLDDPIFCVNITPNRSDLLGVYGIARELNAKGIGKLKPLQLPNIKEQFKTNVQINIENLKDCNLYSIREINNIINQPSPKWLQELLKNVGVSAISCVVDITNYIALTFGQPLHAYDRIKLTNNLYISKLNTPNTFAALNNVIYDLPPHSLIIKDDENIHCLAGIIGGIDSACSLTTTDIILEAAVFDPIAVTTTGRALQIQTESRYRFERGVDKEFTLNALDLATAMILELCGGQASNMAYKTSLATSSPSIEFPINYAEKIIGIPFEYTLIVDILKKLGFEIKISENKSINNIIISPPSWRHDIAIKEDIIEELIRVYGYDNLPCIELPKMDITKIIPSTTRLFNNIKRSIASSGYDEVVTWSFMKKEDAEKFGEINDNLELLNPISQELNYMRQTIIPNLLKILIKNELRSIKNLAIFEMGPVFNNADENGEHLMVSGIRSGFFNIKHWYENARSVDIFDIKSDLEIILQNTAVRLSELQITSDNNPKYYHPMRSSCLRLGKKIIGYFGEIHPRILRDFNIKSAVVAFELNIENLPTAKNKYGKRGELTISDLQFSVRDFSFIVDKDLETSRLINHIFQINKKLITEVNISDIYTNEAIFPNKKSVSLTVKIQPFEENLTDNDLIHYSNLIITSIEKNFDAKLRG